MYDFSMDIDYLRETVSYDPESGGMFWLQRPKYHFKGTKGYNLWKTRFAGKAPGSLDQKGYKRIPINGKVYRAHRLAWAVYYGEHPDGEVDHINGDPADNRIANLRVVKGSQNSRNQKRRKDNKTGIPGVSWWPSREKWQAKIGIGKSKSKSLGFFETKDEAIAARRAAEIILDYHPNHGRE